MPDRDAQFQPLISLFPQMLAARKGSDAAAAAVNAQSAVVDGLNRQYNLLKSKVGPWGGATADDYVAFGQVMATLPAAQQKLSDLSSTATAAHLAFTGMWTPGQVLYNNLLADPGAVEQV